MGLNDLLDTPEKHSSSDGRETTKISEEVLLVCTLRGVSFFPSRYGPELLYVTRGLVSFQLQGEGYHVTQGYSTFLPEDDGDPLILSPDTEALLVPTFIPEGNERIYSLNKHSDVRGTIVDLTRTVRYLVADVRVEFGPYYGDHDQLFHCIEGGFDIHFEHPETKEGSFYRVEAGQQVKVPLGIAYLVVSDPGMRMVNVSSRPFKQKGLTPYTMERQVTR